MTKELDLSKLESRYVRALAAAHAAPAGDAGADARAALDIAASELNTLVAEDEADAPEAPAEGDEPKS